MADRTLHAEQLDRLVHGLQVVRRLAHAHEDHPPHGLQGARQHHLGDDLGTAELALQAAGAGHAEHAADRAADLGRHADPAARQQHGFHRLSVGQVDQQAGRSVCARMPRAQARERRQLGLQRRQGLAKAARQEVADRTAAGVLGLGLRPVAQHPRFVARPGAQAAQALADPFDVHRLQRRWQLMVRECAIGVVGSRTIQPPSRDMASPPPLRTPATDTDPAETEDWIQALQDVVRLSGQDRGLYLLKRLEEQAQHLGIVAHIPPYSAYRNTIDLDQQGRYPGDLLIEERITSMIRWNALAMVVRANSAYGELGGHIGSFASAAEIFEVGFNHFFRGGEHGDLVFFQPHSAPGVYARAFLEGRLEDDQLAHYRQEVGGHGLSSYPHPWLMPQFWQFPTGSMGLGPISAIYQARFMRYLEQRGLVPERGRRVWGVFGDGEMDEPESVGALTLAARDGLDNLSFIINCNLQRLDGPVRGNSQIIQELESLFNGAGWNVIKVLWGSDWDELFARDHTHALLRAFAETPDGEYQTLGANDGHYNFERFFGRAPELRKLVSHLSEAQIDALKRGGHDFRKLYAAMNAARTHAGQPTVILAKTKKGYGMGAAGESRMTVHQQKKLDVEALKAFRDRFALPLSDEDVASMRFQRFAEGSPEDRYLRERRAALGGALPMRRRAADPVPIPPIANYADFALKADGKAMSTTMAMVRLLGNLLRDPALGPRMVPIVADEARTFGMAGLFRQIGIYSPVGQRYEPEDQGSMLAYREATDGQLLEEGITEAGALSSWVAAATAYSVHGLAMLPVYIYYSMFGFQRVGDLIWAAADQRARGFLIGATAGRTTLGGEGLQHQDGSSHLMAATVPNCRA